MNAKIKLITFFTAALALANPVIGQPGAGTMNTESSVAAFSKPAALQADQNMYVIEREIPNAGDLTEAELQGISKKSCSVIEELGPRIQWLHSYVTGDKIYCVYLAPDEELVREHAFKGGFPADSVSTVETMIDPGTAN